MVRTYTDVILTGMDSLVEHAIAVGNALTLRRLLNEVGLIHAHVVVDTSLRILAFRMYRGL